MGSQKLKSKWSLNNRSQTKALLLLASKETTIWRDMFACLGNIFSSRGSTRITANLKLGRRWALIKKLKLEQLTKIFLLIKTLIAEDQKLKLNDKDCQKKKLKKFLGKVTNGNLRRGLIKQNNL